MKREQYIQAFSKYLPEAFVDYVVDLILRERILFKIVRPRKSKLGDFSVQHDGSRPTITVNGNLNPYSFLVTTLHELAHLKTYQSYGNRVQPHGLEWKNAFRELLIPVLENDALPSGLKHVLWQSFTNLKASSCTDVALARELKKFDHPETTQLPTLEQIPFNSTFVLAGKIYRKGNLRRTRYLCQELKSGKQFLVHSLANVQLINLNHEK